MTTIASINTPPLTKGMFGSEFSSKAAYGLRCGQMNNGRRGHNAGWYNARGEKLGWGDLSQEDVDRLMAILPEGELFITLPESASFWDFVTDIGQFGWTCATDPTVENPGIEYVLKRTGLILAKGREVRVEPWSSFPASTLVKGSDTFTTVKKWEDLLSYGSVVNGEFKLASLAGGQ